MDQLKALDSLFLDLETVEIQANIGGVSIFEGPAPSYEELVAHLEAQLDHHPRYRQHLRFPPLRLGGPVWADDPDFDIERHIIDEALPDPQGMEQLTELYARIAGDHLDRKHSLWQLNFVEELEGGRWAVCWKVHHAMVDGIAAKELLDLLLAPDPDAHDPKLHSWLARPEPTDGQLLAKTFTSPFGPRKIFDDIVGAAEKPRRAAGHAWTATRTLLPIARAMLSNHDSPLNGPIGQSRRYAVTKLDLDEIKAVSKLHGGTVNDVVLAACASGIRELLLSRGRQPHCRDARTMVPVSVRSENAHGELDNEVSAVFVDLPVDVDDPLERLIDVRGQMNHLKQAEGAAAGEALFELAGYVPPVLFSIGERLAWKVADTQRLMNTIATNVPGPQFPLFCLGRKMTELYPYVMLPKNIRVATAIFSYDGGVYFGVSGDYDAVPDIQAVCDGIDAAVGELLAAEVAETD